MLPHDKISCIVSHLNTPPVANRVAWVLSILTALLMWHTISSSIVCASHVWMARKYVWTMLYNDNKQILVHEIKEFLHTVVNLYLMLNWLVGDIT